MNENRMVRVGLGGTVLGVLVASCPIQLAVLGALGLGAAVPWLHRVEPIFYVVVASFVGLAITGAMRIRRRRRAAVA